MAKAKVVDAFTIVSNVGEWSSFMEKLMELHRAQKGSALANTKPRYDMNLVNFASTMVDGQPFPYFKAVDEGRSPVGPKGVKKVVAFALDSPSAIRFAGETRGTTGANIVAKSNAQIRQSFSQELVDRFRDYLDDKGGEGEVFTRSSSGEITGKATVTLGRAVVSIPRTKAIRAGEFDESTGKFKTVQLGLISEPETIPLLGDVDVQLNITELSQVQQKFDKTVEKVILRLLKEDPTLKWDDAIERAEKLSEGVRIKEEARLLGKAERRAVNSALKLLRQKGGPSDVQSARKGFFRALGRVANWVPMSVIFLSATRKQIDIYKSNTPVRTTWKLIEAGRELSTLAPPPGGQLRSSYALKSNKDIEKLILGTKA